MDGHERDSERKVLMKAENSGWGKKADLKLDNDGRVN